MSHRALLHQASMRAPLLIPDLDSNAHCERVAGDAGGDAAMRRCLWVEEYARSELETFWPSTRVDIRPRCIEQNDEESYAELARCVLRLRRAR